MASTSSSKVEVPATRLLELMEREPEGSERWAYLACMVVLQKVQMDTPESKGVEKPGWWTASGLRDLTGRILVAVEDADDEKRGMAHLTRAFVLVDGQSASLVDGGLAPTSADYIEAQAHFTDAAKLTPMPHVKAQFEQNAARAREQAQCVEAADNTIEAMRRMALFGSADPAVAKMEKLPRPSMPTLLLLAAFLGGVSLVGYTLGVLANWW